MKTLIIKDLPLVVELSSDTASNIMGGMISLYDYRARPRGIPDESGISGSSWPKEGIRGLAPTYAVDGSPV